MKNEKCNYCGSVRYSTKKTDYLYSHNGKYLLVPNVPVEVCDSCGMIYYDAKNLLDIEKHFFAISNNEEKPDGFINVPHKSLYAA
jgi:YgiT-type zinc finger domain-containing protein